jgi:hypothetical protein
MKVRFTNTNRKMITLSFKRQKITNLQMQILTRSHKCRYFSIPEPVQIGENQCLRSPLYKACYWYLNLITQKIQHICLHFHEYFLPTSSMFSVHSP